MSMLPVLYSTFRRFAACESGTTAIEYAMIAAGVGTVVAGAVQSLGTGLKTTLYDKLASIMP
jgi:pilus assembly protein Flp/PilA